MRIRTATSVPLLLGAALVLTSTALAPVGAADTTVGAAFAPDQPCGDITAVQSASVGNDYRVPVAGVITSWRYVAGGTPPTSVAFRLGRASGPSISIVGAGPSLVPTAGRALEQPLRIATQAGDLVGVHTAGGQCAVVAAGGDLITYAFGDVTSGPLTSAQSDAGFRLDVAATVEPDADGDGFGDTSQDLCPNDATTQAVCGTGAPDTVITGVGAAKAKSAAKKAKVTTTFSSGEAATFECAVDSPVFTRCASPYVVKLRAGKHVIAVRATDAAGNVDKSAAVRAFKVKVAKKR